MKRSGQCPKCGERRVARLEVVADAGDWVGQGSGSLEGRTGYHTVPRRVLLVRKETTGLFGGKGETFDEAGTTEGFVCTACGYLEEYLKDVASIPWNDVVGARPWQGQG